MSPGFFARQFEAIASRESLAAVAQQLELPNRWNLSQKSVVQMLKGIVSVQNIRGTDLLSIRVRHTSKQDAAAIAAAVAKNYQRSFPGNAVIHEEPLEPLIPVSPNVGLIVAAGGLLGLILSPLLALILIVFLQIIFGSGKPAGYIIR
jgi:capsular polysaccharide biosynthesis protein